MYSLTLARARSCVQARADACKVARGARAGRVQARAVAFRRVQWRSGAFKSRSGARAQVRPFEPGYKRIFIASLLRCIRRGETEREGRK